MSRGGDDEDWLFNSLSAPKEEPRNNASSYNPEHMQMTAPNRPGPMQFIDPDAVEDTVQDGIRTLRYRGREHKVPASQYPEITHAGFGYMIIDAHGDRVFIPIGDPGPPHTWQRGGGLPEYMAKAFNACMSVDVVKQFDDHWRAYHNATGQFIEWAVDGWGGREARRMATLLWERGCQLTDYEINVYRPIMAPRYSVCFGPWMIHEGGHGDGYSSDEGWW